MSILIGSQCYTRGNSKRRKTTNHTPGQHNSRQSRAQAPLPIVAVVPCESVLPVSNMTLTEDHSKITLEGSYRKRQSSPIQCTKTRFTQVIIGSVKNNRVTGGGEERELIRLEHALHSHSELLLWCSGEISLHTCIFSQFSYKQKGPKVRSEKGQCHRRYLNASADHQGILSQYMSEILWGKIELATVNQMNLASK